MILNLSNPERGLAEECAWRKGPARTLPCRHQGQTSMALEATGPLCPCGSCKTTVSRLGALQMAHRGLGQLGQHRKDKGKGASSQEGVSVMWSLCLCVYNGKAAAPDTLNINVGGNAKTCTQTCSLSAASSLTGCCPASTYTPGRRGAHLYLGQHSFAWVFRKD